MTRLLTLGTILLGCLLHQSSRGNDIATLPINLDDIRLDQFIEFIKVAVPETDSRTSQQPLDLPTLSLLHAYFLRATILPLGQPSALRTPVRESTQRLEEAMRGALARTDFARLQEWALKDRKNHPRDSEVFKAYCHARITQEVERLIAAHPTVAFPAKPAAAESHAFPILPGVDRQDFLRALSPYRTLISQLSKQPSAAGGQDSGSASEKLLVDPHAKVADQLMVFKQDSWCGYGMFEAEATQATLGLIALLQEGRIAEAVGLSFSVPSEPAWMREPGHPFDQWRTNLLRYCGFDPETMYLCSGNIELLAALGSEKAAWLGIEALKKGDTYSHLRWSLEKLILFLKPGAPIRWETEDPRLAISGKAQTAIFTLLEQSLRESETFAQLDQQLDLYALLRRPETKPVWERLLQHPSTTYAQRAVEILRSIGERHDAIPPAPPVRFRYLLNGQPWRSTRLNYEIWDEERKNSAHYGSVETDAEGFGEIPRDAFLDYQMRRPRLQLSQRPQPGRVTHPQVYNQGWVDSEEVPVNAPFDQTGTINFIAARLPIQVTYGSRAPTARPPAAASITLFRLGQQVPSPWQFLLQFEKDTLPLPEQFAFGTLAPGRYQLEIAAPGFAHYFAPLEVKTGMPPLQIKLEEEQ